MFNWFKRKKPVEQQPERAVIKRVRRMRKLLEEIGGTDAPAITTRPFEPARPMDGVVPKSLVADVMAMDATPYGYLNYSASANNTFPGYAYLSELAQLPEYRKINGIIAEEMTRKWIRITSTDDVSAERVAQLTEACKRYKLQEVFERAALVDNQFGRSHIYPDLKTPSGILASDDHVELGTPLTLSPKKIPKDSLIGFNVIEPMWSYPANYNSTNPLKKNYYKPESWFVMGDSVHESRLLFFCANPVPDILKAAYSFGGVSMSQLAEPYVNNWLRTRQSVSDMIHSYSISGLKTNMQSTLATALGGGDTGQWSDLICRVAAFARFRDNRGVFVLDNETEDFFQFNTPLSGLDALQNQALEQMFMVSSIPAVKFAGIQPSGLNASSDGEIRTFYDGIHSRQEKVFRGPLKKALDIIQLSEFGAIDESITFEFEPLYQLSKQEEATARKIEAETDQIYVDMGVVSPEAVYTRIKTDAKGPYSSMEDDDNGDEEEGEPEERTDNRGVASH